MEGLTLDQLHDDVEHTIRITKIVNRNEVGVVEPGHRFRLGFKARTKLWVRAKLTGKDLDCDGTIERDLPGGVDGAHSSLCNERSNLVGREVRLELLYAGSLKIEIG